MMKGNNPHSRRRVGYFHDPAIGDFHYGPGHPMKPHRISITHELIQSYGLLQKMENYRQWKASEEEMMGYHSIIYINFLKSICPEDADEKPNWRQRLYNVGHSQDCPIFTGVYEFSQLSAGASIAGAVKLNRGELDIAINWAGGLHHAKRQGASGFCYINDAVLGILELLKCHQRVVYIDIDVHHGDGVEEAFRTTDRVMTVSFHMYDGEFFPGTGQLTEVGHGDGKYYTVNVPLKRGITDNAYTDLFQSVMSKVMEHYQPNAIVLQSGADSLSGDRLGCFNLSLKGHASCLQFMKSYNLPLLLLGGGGYTIKNVARCWTYETAVAVGVEIPDFLPQNDYYKYFELNDQLHIHPSGGRNIKNCNRISDLNTIKSKIFEHLRMLPCAPSAQLQEIPMDGLTVAGPSRGENRTPEEGLAKECNELSEAGKVQGAEADTHHHGRLIRKSHSRPRIWTPRSRHVGMDLPGPSSSGSVPSTSQASVGIQELSTESFVSAPSPWLDKDTETDSDGDINTRDVTSNESNEKEMLLLETMTFDEMDVNKALMDADEDDDDD